MADLKFKGYAIHDTNKWTDFEVIDFSPKRAEDFDVDVEIQYCGVCGSDLHTVSGGWGQPMLPVIPGHEIVGIVKHVGPKVTEFKIGDRVGVGAQIGACLDCANCNDDNENYCANGPIDTYNAKYPNGDIAYGGYSAAIRAHEKFVFPIPDAIESEVAGPLFCAGLTVFSPLVRYGIGPGKTVGIVGMGGLGHMAVQFARALGADKVVLFSHSDRKKEDALKLGATDFVATKGGADVFKPWAFSLDLIVSTMNVAEGFPLTELLGCLKVNKSLITVGLPNDPLPGIMAASFTKNGVTMGSSHIGSKKEALEMLKLAAEKNVRPIVQVLPMSKAGEALEAVENGDVRYRYVLKADL